MNLQKSSIASRLLEISLKVDDYVYKSIPISSKKAALFLTEVSGYKDKCLGDKRSSQVRNCSLYRNRGAPLVLVHNFYHLP